MFVLFILCLVLALISAPSLFYRKKFLSLKFEYQSKLFEFCALVPSIVEISKNQMTFELKGLIRLNRYEASLRNQAEPIHSLILIDQDISIVTQKYFLQLDSFPALKNKSELKALLKILGEKEALLDTSRLELNKWIQKKKFWNSFLLSEIPSIPEPDRSKKYNDISDFFRNNK